MPEAFATYRFSVGQKVAVSTAGTDRLPTAGSFRVTARLPAEQGEQQYRIQHEREVFERKVGENRLTLVKS
jgi:hypothetical protein